jgi:hypothetical protein
MSAGGAFIFDLMTHNAARLLEASGAPSFREIFESDRAPEKVLTDLEVWCSRIKEQLGASSPAGVAAQFVLASERCRQHFDATKDDADILAELCDAWHLLFMEISGEQRLAETGLKAAEGRERGPEKRRSIREAKDRIIEARRDSELTVWNAPMRPSARANTKDMARRILAAVNNDFKENGWPPYQQETLERRLKRMNGQSSE